jgi:hypothetical protein
MTYGFNAGTYPFAGDPNRHVVSDVAAANRRVATSLKGVYP